MINHPRYAIAGYPCYFFLRNFEGRNLIILSRSRNECEEVLKNGDLSIAMKDSGGADRRFLYDDVVSALESTIKESTPVVEHDLAKQYKKELRERHESTLDKELINARHFLWFDMKEIEKRVKSNTVTPTELFKLKEEWFEASVKLKEFDSLHPGYTPNAAKAGRVPIHLTRRIRMENSPQDYKDWFNEIQDICDELDSLIKERENLIIEFDQKYGRNAYYKSK